MGRETRGAELWLASGNRHKRLELARILSGVALKIPADGGIDGFDPPETGASFMENALLKARALSRILGERGIFEPVLADDSGLCVDALGGRPGIYSARYSGRYGGRSDGSCGGGPEALKILEAPERNRLLLEELGDASDRRARFVCAMVLLFDEHRFACVQETLEGEIAAAQGRGEGGFGYDPILYLPGRGRTVAELGEDEKNRISHRAKAARAIAALLGSGGTERSATFSGLR
ncbi:MAG: RdgB/HAM1 family non-canonical purine NTP pyrophosphatase [Treponema sp.]|jgi:XTP/dITP diphosphohydrolase|nr:RdgB/HAM1 family non-canonical purine NTP pyrophosphatase [Treponema sp.]